MLESAESILSLAISIGRFCGVCPFRQANKNDPVNYVFYPLGYVYSIFVGILSSSIVMYVFIESSDEKGITLTHSLRIIRVWFGMLIWLMFVYNMYTKRSATCEVIYDILTTAKQIGIKSFNRKYLATNIIFVGLTCFQYFMRVYLNHGFHWIMYVVFLPIGMFNNAPYMIANQYAIFMCILSDQIRYITNQLKSVSFNVEVHQLVDFHFQLCSIGDRINMLFGTFLLAALTVPFLVTILKIYTIIVFFVKPDVYSDVGNLIQDIFVVLLNSVGIFIITAAASSPADEAENFNEQLFSTLLTSKTLVKDNSLRMYLSMNYSIKPTACDFFSLHFSLLTSMMAASVTYVILLVQFTLMK